MLIKKIYLILFLLILLQHSFASEKKGACLADLKSADRINALNVSWYYTWKPYPIKGTSANFVPMLWGGKQKRLKKELKVLRSMGKVPVLLVFNEPDKKDQANMTVEQVVKLWPEIKQLADKISSPAVAGGTNQWFKKFYNIAKKKHLKFDFIAVHLYTSPNPKKFLKKIDYIYKKYHLPIWITEFAVADWKSSKRNCKLKKKYKCKNKYSEKEVLEFMKAVLPELEKRPYVEKYAWFGAGHDCYKREQVRTSCLFDKYGKLTSVGCFYALFKWPKEKSVPKNYCKTVKVKP